ncbi:hypothetical protein DBB29_00645 [Pandoraea cepalis]|uniref:TrfB transcriptional repressor protein domain-containing protein n=1 Tax=Pandoraea cepalis TaxID=2508294 RepID=A0AAW7MGU8_9BURK|nr:TrfB-related DNA-binding protein [Pandoraea cepalis]MDN4571990.1 hypothetical protein [Pandoraea cepalis]MDN4576641.1 hypothetical protein [Pandoraea cepalis]
MADIDALSPALLTEHEFDLAIVGRRFSEGNVALAKIVLCQGTPVIAVANEHGVPRQQLHRVVDSILSAHRAQARIPDNWVRATVVGPPAEVKKFNARMENLLRKLRK